MKEVKVKDEEAVANFTVGWLEKVKENPEKYMPRCILCSTERSNILMVFPIEGETRTTFFGVCKKCCPDGVDDEAVKKVMEKVEKFIDGQGDGVVLHVTPQEWSQ
jgi:hypothetical protein